MRHVRPSALALALLLLFSLTACKPAADQPSAAPSQAAASPAPSSQEPSQAPSQSPSLADDETPDIRFAVLSGPTGVGAAKLLDHIDHNDIYLSYDNFRYNIYNDNSELVADLINGEIDIATVASNVAVNLYNKTDGGVKIIAVGTLGVLHILEGGGGDTVHSIADLAGRTVYCAGQGANPEYILRYLIRETEMDAAEVKLVFADASEISAKLLSGEIQYAMLPVPAATAAIMKSEGRVRAAIDLTEAWDGLKNGSQLVMTAVVARTQFAQEHPDRVAAFLTDYEASIDFVNGNVDAAAEIVARLGITPSAPIAKQAIPQCHLAFLAGTDMVAAISDYYSVLWSIDPAAVGGSLPDSGIYWTGG